MNSGDRGVGFECNLYNGGMSDANIFPVDYDAGASAVNQENRIKLMLSIARDNKAARAGQAETDGQTERGETTDNATAEAAATVSENNDIEDNL